MLVYLGICAILSFGLAILGLSGAVLPPPSFLSRLSPVALYHVFFASGAMPLVIAAVLHFVPVLTRSEIAPLSLRRLPVLVQLAGALVPLGMSGLLPYASLHLAATLVALASVVVLMWLLRRWRATLGPAHASIRWYGVALLCLFFAVSLVPVWSMMPALMPALRTFHLHLNTLGFIGLAALGTLPVLLPTAMGVIEPEANRRLEVDLPAGSTGAILIAAGAAGAQGWLASLGAGLLAWVAVRHLLAWRRSFGLRGLFRDGAAASLATATGGLCVLLMAGVAHGLGHLSARTALAGFVSLFLLPLVTGALAQLLPVWRWPGMDSPRRKRLRLRLAQGGAARSGLFFAGGLAMLLDAPAGLVFVALALLHFFLAVVRGFWLDSPGPSDDNPAPVSIKRSTS